MSLKERSLASVCLYSSSSLLQDREVLRTKTWSLLYPQTERKQVLKR